MANPSMVPLAELQTYVANALRACPQLNTFRQVEVVREDGTKADLVANKLAEIGSVIVVVPPIHGKRRDPSRNSNVWVGDSTIGVRIIINPQVNFAAGNLNVEPIRLVELVIEGLINTKQKAGSEPFRVADDAYMLDQSDPGRYAYNVYFTKETML